jgi:hypothetical protein
LFELALVISATRAASGHGAPPAIHSLIQPTCSDASLSASFGGIFMSSSLRVTAM